ncbi:acyl-CoA dehydrogenase family protein [Pseudofrankia asymbiotica]|uniref:Acyl-CoA dehydrogenase n=1 Tax=Pseudofrankia asymbiotica TaxID=1834516 RepID=A0A1V2I2J2_9ACTN|nr:acyl-CoA dehydrogenase [Pseudofrankia asymbiotica]
MDFEYSQRTNELVQRVRHFMTDQVIPAEAVYEAQLREQTDYHQVPRIMQEMKAEAHAAGLWNLAMTHGDWGAGLSNLDYAPIAEEMGRSILGNEVFNCAAPDTGNMELLALFGSPEQQNRWLRPLLAGDMKSSFAMTEPDVASSDARNIATSIERDGGSYVINGRKWFTSGICDPACALIIVMGVTDPAAPTYRQQSMVLVPRNSPGVTIVRDLPYFGYVDRMGHGEVTFTDVRVPAASILAGEGEGFALAQGRLGPGRMHYGMRAIGMAERALELLTRRVLARRAFGAPLSDRGVIREWIARSRIEIDEARLLVLRAAWLMDTVGNKAARTEVAAIKVSAMGVAHRVIDRAIQGHGGAGVTDDTPLARLYALSRALRIADGPDEVHLRTIARLELAKYKTEPHSVA